MKKTILVYLILCLIAPITIEAKKKRFGNGLYWELKNNTLTISGNGNMPNYTSGQPYFPQSYQISKIIIENGVTSIGCNAFSGCSSLSSVVIPNSVTSIGEWAFDGCSSLTSVTIPNSVTFIGLSAFSGCRRLSSVVIPNSVTSIGEFAFSGCSSLSSVVIPNSVTSIRNGAFDECTSLSSVVIPNSVTYIGEYAFNKCRSLSSVVIPNSVTSIKEEAFSFCSSLSSVVIPNSVTSIGKCAFWDCNNLSSIIVPNSVTDIGNNAFYLSNRPNNRAFVVIPNTCRYSSNNNDNRETYRGETITLYNYRSNPCIIVERNSKKGLIDNNGRWIIPSEKNYSQISLAGNNLLKVQDFQSGNWGIITLDGTEIIPTSRGYTYIGDYDSNNGTFAFKKRGFTGTCDAQGREISTIRNVQTADDIKAIGSYASAVEMMNGSTKYYKVSKNGRYGLTDSEGREIIPCEMEALESAGTGYLRYKINGFWGVMNYTGHIIIDTDRGYTSIGNFVSFTRRFPYTMTGWRGECDINGRELSRIKVETTQPAVTSSTPSSNSNNNNSNNNQGGQSTTVVVEHHHDPVPMQVWKQCGVCLGSGMCQSGCNGTGWFTAFGRSSRCIGCGGSGRCQFCAGNGGHYEVEYR